MSLIRFVKTFKTCKVTTYKELPDSIMRLFVEMQRELEFTSASAVDAIWSFGKWVLLVRLYDMEAIQDIRQMAKWRKFSSIDETETGNASTFNAYTKYDPLTRQYLWKVEKHTDVPPQYKIVECADGSAASQDAAKDETRIALGRHFL